MPQGVRRAWMPHSHVITSLSVTRYVHILHAPAWDRT